MKNMLLLLLTAMVLPNAVEAMENSDDAHDAKVRSNLLKEASKTTFKYIIDNGIPWFMENAESAYYQAYSVPTAPPPTGVSLFTLTDNTVKAVADSGITTSGYYDGGAVLNTATISNGSTNV